MVGISIRVREALGNGNGLDGEWIDLILTAKDIGLSVGEVSAFINEHQAFRDNELYLQFVKKCKEY